MAPATRLLYVDDEPTLLEIAKIFLEAKGDFIVDTLTSANEALVVLNTVKYDAIISDYQMPAMDGITFLKKLKESGNTTPFIIFTGRGREEIVIQALNEGADFYLQKGGEPRSQFAELAHKIHQAVHQREAAASIRDLERREADIINFLPDATFAIDTKGVVIAWNRAMEMMTGVKADQILGKGNYEYAIPFYHERRPILIDLVFKDDPVTAGKYPAITHEGTTLFSEITIPHFNKGRGSALWFTASPLYDRQGTVVGAIESIRDITERKRTEEALIESEKRFRELSDLLPQIVYEADREGNLTYANRIAFEQFGYSEDDFLQGLNFLQMLAPGELERASESFRATFAGKEKTNPINEYLALRKDGSTFPVSIYSSPIFSNNGIAGLRGIIVDITERKRNEKALADSGRRLRRAERIAGLGHWEFDLETRKVYASDGARSLYGLYANSSTIPEVQKIPLPEYRPMLDEALRALVEDNRPYDVEFQIRRLSDGKILDIHSIAEYDPTKKVVFGVIQNITERKRQDHILINQLDLGLALQSIRGLKETLETCLKGSIDISGMDGGGIYLVNGNDGSVDLIVSRNLGDEFVKNASHYPSESENARIVMAGKPIFLQYDKTGVTQTPFVEREGLKASAIIPILYSGRVIACLNISSHSEDEIPANARIALETIATQIGTAIERIRADEAHKESEERYRNIVEDQTEFISRFLPDGTHVFVNDAYCRYFGLKREDILGHRFRPDIPAEDKERMKRFFASLTHDHPVDTIKHRIIMPDGRIRWQRWSDRAIFNNAGKITEYQSVGRDITDEKEAEIALKASEERYRTLAETSNDIIFVIGRDDRVEYVNSFASAMLKKPVEQILGSPRSTLFPPDVTGHQKKALETVFEKGAPVRSEGVMTINGKIHWFDHILMPLKGPDEQVRSVLGISRDITKRKLVEEELRESELKYRILLDESSDPIFSFYPDGTYHYVNRAFAEGVGKSVDQIIGKKIWDVFPKDEAEKRFSTLRSVFSTGEGKEFEVRVPRPDGDRYYVTTIVPIKDDKGSVVSAICSSKEITGRKKVEEALREREEKYRHLIENSHDIIYTMTPMGEFIYVSPSWTLLLGHTVTEVVGKTFQQFVHPDDMPVCMDFLKKTIEDGIRQPYVEYRVQHDDGSWRWHTSKSVPLRDETGRIIGFEGIASDITGRKQAEEALQQANKKLNLLSSITRHDINNQLLALNGFLELLHEKIQNPAFEEYFNRIEQASTGISTMIEFTREYEMIGVAAPIWHTCRTLVDTVSKDAPLGKVVVKNDLPSSLEVFADPLITRVYYNLMDNAARYGGSITSIRFYVMECDGNQIIVCEDDGDGVPAEEKERIFNRGFGRNTGMGLYLTREILSITGITIRETGVQGKGGRFEIAVPKGAYRFNKE